jgi:hypothetical protein
MYAVSTKISHAIGTRRRDIPACPLGLPVSGN